MTDAGRAGAADKPSDGIRRALEPGLPESRLTGTEGSLLGLIPETAEAPDGSQNKEVRLYSCVHCCKPFRSKQQLHQHSLVHTGLRKHHCSFCDKTFKQLSHLQQHHRIHTGEKPYRCTFEDCDRAFAQLSNLQHHLRNHDDQVKKAANKLYQCVICHRSYTNEGSLKSHTLKMHVHIRPTSPTELKELPPQDRQRRRKSRPMHIYNSPTMVPLHSHAQRGMSPSMAAQRGISPMMASPSMLPLHPQGTDDKCWLPSSSPMIDMSDDITGDDPRRGSHVMRPCNGQENIISRSTKLPQTGTPQSPPVSHPLQLTSSSGHSLQSITHARSNGNAHPMLGNRLSAGISHNASASHVYDTSDMYAEAQSSVNHSAHATQSRNGSSSSPPRSNHYSVESQQKFSPSHLGLVARSGNNYTHSFSQRHLLSDPSRLHPALAGYKQYFSQELEALRMMHMPGGSDHMLSGTQPVTPSMGYSPIRH